MIYDKALPKPYYHPHNQSSLATPKQVEFILDLLADCKFDDDTRKAYYLARTGKVIASVAELSLQQAKSIIPELKQYRNCLRCGYTPPDLGFTVTTVEAQPPPLEPSEPVEALQTRPDDVLPWE